MTSGWAKRLKAFVVLNKDAKLTAEEFIDWCKDQFAANKYPRYVEFRDELPIGETGKISKLLLRGRGESSVNQMRRLKIFVTTGSCFCS